MTVNAAVILLTQIKAGCRRRSTIACTSNPLRKGRIMKRSDQTGIARLVLLAGFAGGAAEVLWVALYSGITGTNATVVAQQVTASVSLVRMRAMSELRLTLTRAGDSWRVAQVLG